MSLATPDLDISEETRQSVESPWKVILHNDDVNVFPYVIKTLQLVLEKPKEVCERYALEVHENGRSTVFDGAKEEAEQKATQLTAAMLWATVEKGE